jgi:hypothetical protein
MPDQDAEEDDDYQFKFNRQRNQRSQYYESLKEMEKAESFETLPGLSEVIARSPKKAATMKPQS